MKRNHDFLLPAASFFALFSSVEVAAQAPAPVTLVKAGQTAFLDIPLRDLDFPPASATIVALSGPEAGRARF